MINRIVLMGRICRDVELRVTGGQNLSVCSFAVAVDRRYAKPGEEKQTDFIPVVAWRQQAEFVSKYFKMGDMIAVEGYLQSRNYEDKNGNKRTAYEVVADNISFCGGKKDAAKQGSTQTKTSYAQNPETTQMRFGDPVLDDDDLPF